MVSMIMTSSGLLRPPFTKYGAALLLAGALLAAPGGPAVAADKTCRISNVDAGTRFRSLQVAVDAASAGDRLRVQGTCVGTTVVDKSLVIRGVETGTSGRPTLDGDRALRVLAIASGATVELKDLIVRRGWVSTPEVGGGILNAGTLTLLNVIVVGNRGFFGGGIHTTGDLILNGTTTIHHNESGDFEGDGGGVASNGGSVTMNDSSSIHTNRSDRGGGGLYGVDSTLTLNGTSSVHDNEAGSGGGGIYADFESALVLNDQSSVADNVAAERAGGVFNNSSFTMNGASTITGNEAGTRGGGVFVGCGAETVGVHPGGNVKSNKPSNLVREQQGCP